MDKDMLKGIGFLVWLGFVTVCVAILGVVGVIVWAAVKIVEALI